MQIKGVDLARKKVNRDRAINYWKENVVQNFLPPIDKKKKVEVDERVQQLKKTETRRMNSSIGVRSSFTSNLSPMPAPHSRKAKQASNSVEDDTQSQVVQLTQ